MQAARKFTVASFTGTWVETGSWGTRVLFWCRILYGCVGWNKLWQKKLAKNPKSHLLWVRGLKLAACRQGLSGTWSYPAGVRGLKHRCCRITLYPLQSYPAGVRGLKLTNAPIGPDLMVASFIGAWVETTRWWAIPTLRWSHPYGCADWNLNPLYKDSKASLSHPLWVHESSYFFDVKEPLCSQLCP